MVNLHTSDNSNCLLLCDGYLPPLSDFLRTHIGRRITRLSTIDRPLNRDSVAAWYLTAYARRTAVQRRMDPGNQTLQTWIVGPPKNANTTLTDWFNGEPSNTSYRLMIHHCSYSTDTNALEPYLFHSGYCNPTALIRHRRGSWAHLKPSAMAFLDSLLLTLRHNDDAVNNFWHSIGHPVAHSQDLTS